MEEELPSEQKALFVEASVENGLGQPGLVEWKIVGRAKPIPALNFATVRKEATSCEPDPA
jgi:hypothetical protein